MRLKVLLPWTLFVLASGAALWLGSPGLFLAFADHQLNKIYRECRPFAYRWPGAPHGGVSSRRAPAESVSAIRGWIAAAEKRSGRTSYSLRLSGRLDEMSGHPDQAVAAFRLASLLAPEDGEVLSELASAYALRAVAEKRAFDWAPALDATLRATSLAKHSQTAAFNAAAMFEDCLLPRQAERAWKQVGLAETESAWRNEAHDHEKALRAGAQARAERSARAVADTAGANTASQGASELATEAALNHWLRDRRTWRPQLDSLARELERKHHDKWLGDLLRSPDTEGTNAALLALSDAWRFNSASEHVQAERSAADAARQFRALHNRPGELRARLEHVMALQRQLKPEQCLQALAGVGEEAQAQSYQWIRGQAWLDRMACLGQQRQDVLAKRERAFEWIQTTGYQGLEMRALGFLMEPQVGLGNPLKTWERGYQGLRSYSEGVLPPIRVQPLYYNLAESAGSWEYPFAAIALAREAALTLEETERFQLRGLVLARLASFEARAGLREEAVADYRRAGHELDMGRADSQKVAVLHALAEVEQANGEMLGGNSGAAIARLRKLDNFDFGIYYNDLFVRPSLGEALLGNGETQLAIQEFRKALAESDQRRAKLTSLLQRESFQLQMARAYRGLTQAELDEGSPTLALETWEKFRSGGSPAPFDASRLPRGTALLVFANLTRGVCAWFADSHGVQQHFLEAGRWRSQAGELLEEASNPQSSAETVAATGKALSAAILAPFEKQMPEISTLLIDAEGPLAGLPWALLRSANGELLIERTAIIQVHGMPPPATMRLGSPLILADPELGQKLSEVYPPLLEARREAEHLQSLFGSAEVLTGREATAESLSLRGSFHHLIHFAGHGVSYGGFGALMLAPPSQAPFAGEMLTSEQLRKMNLAGVDLVFLAACSTGAGSSAAAVNLDSLVSSFMQAGAARVIATRWNVNSRPSRELVESFYQLLLAGQPPAEALRRAMLSISHQPAFAHPYYWAGFAAFGAI